MIQLPGNIHCMAYFVIEIGWQWIKWKIPNIVTVSGMDTGYWFELHYE